LISIIAIFFGISILNVNAQDSIFSFGSDWKYYDQGEIVDSNWKKASYNDNSWASGKGEFGYGDGDEQTVVGFGPNAASKYITTYFRKKISIQDLNMIDFFVASVKRDDGVVVYVNGNEVFRNNMNLGTVNFNTLALAASDDGKSPIEFSIPVSVFNEDNNVMAVEIHQNTASSSDMSFDMSLSYRSLDIDPNLINWNSDWKYFDAGSLPEVNWQTLTYNDDLWKSGIAKLGFGDGDENTVIDSLKTDSSSVITHYFRKKFSILDTSLFSVYELNLLIDDGAIIYLNGIKMLNINLPEDSVNENTFALNSSIDDGKTPLSFTLPINAFKKGENVIAIALHQANDSENDASFDVALKAIPQNIPTTFIRKPYLSALTQNSITVKWRTKNRTNSKVAYGSSPDQLNIIIIDSLLSIDHEITLHNLQPDSKYYYNVGAVFETITANDFKYFTTIPLTGDKNSYSFLVMGDMGVNSNSQKNVLNAYLSQKPDDIKAWILLGDNAYQSGNDFEFQTNFFNIYQDKITDNHPIIPIPGNHDYANNLERSRDKNVSYFDIFKFLMNGEAGGVPSNNNAYSSFDYGNIHFVALDTYGREMSGKKLYDTTSIQAQWLKLDLASNLLPWTIVLLHHPPYSKGSHDSDNETDSKQIREQLVPIFERFKVDVVLSGHSHCYERSLLLNGHYGLEATLDTSVHTLSTSSAYYDGNSNSCPYIKNDSDTRNGIVYAIVGSSGNVSSEKSPGYPHNAMYYSDVTNPGSMILNVEDNRLQAKWICGDNIVRDQFTIFKNVGKSQTIEVESGQPLTLKASWAGNHIWSVGAVEREVNVIPVSDTVIIVSDLYNCLSDTFNLKLKNTTGISTTHKSPFLVYPSKVRKGETLTIETALTENTLMNITDIQGKIIKSQFVQGKFQIATANLSVGMYQVTIFIGNQHHTEKFAVVQ
jgi:predicted phosphodiesterase